MQQQQKILLSICIHAYVRDDASKSDAYVWPHTSHGFFSAMHSISLAVVLFLQPQKKPVYAIPYRFLPPP